MILFPNCKINLGLHITRKRQDGYHDLETVFYPLPLTDALEVITAPAVAKDLSSATQQPATGTLELAQEGLTFFSGGLTVAGDTANNLCVKPGGC
jgi:4-diphosphocytidyl-2-C-methyl-D-erythritol kinase